MRVRTRAYAGLALAATIGLTGCGPSTEQAATPGASASAGGSRADADELAAAAAVLSRDTVKVRLNVAGQMSAHGVVDPVRQNASIEMDLGAVDDNTRAEIRKVGDDVWVQLNGPVAQLNGTGDKWMHLDAKSMTPDSSLAVIPGDDPGGVIAMTNAIVAAHKTRPNWYAGTLDLTRTPKYSGAALAALGTDAAAVPFTARTDDQGRLTLLSVDLTSVVSGAGEMTARFSDFGTPVEVEAPAAADTTELPPELRSVINA